MSARDELAELLQVNVTDSLPVDPSRTEIQQQVETAVDVLIAAGYTKPRTIETTEELDALPDMTVIRTAAGTITNLIGKDAHLFGYEKPAARGVLALPATVLYEPGAS